MKILPFHYYDFIMRAGDSQRVGRCFNLVVQELSPEELLEPEVEKLTHVVAFRDSCSRTYLGKIKEDSEERLIFELAGGKEFVFRPIE